MKRYYLLLASLLCITPFCLSQPNATGKWYGMADVGGFKLRIVFDIQKSEQGYSANMQSLDQSAETIPATLVKLEDDKLLIEISNVGFSYKGILNKSAVIEGAFTQAGQTFKLNLSQNEITANERPQEPKPPYPYKVEEVVFTNESANIRLSGTLTFPEVSGSYTSVILVSGSGPQNRDEELMGHKPFLVLADYLTRQGIAVLRYDDRGVGMSEGDYSRAGIDDFVSDAEAGIAYLKTRKDINKDKIGIIGHSEGGSIAFALAAKQIPSFIVTLASPGVDGQRLLHTQREELFKAAGVASENIAQINDYMRQAQNIAIKVTSRFDLEKSIADLFMGTPMENQIAPIIEQLSSPEIVSILKYDPKAYFKKIHCPVLALNGMKDLQVPYNENLSAILEGITANGNKKVAIKSYDSLNHLFQTSETGLPSEYGAISETFNDDVLRDIANWLSEH